PGLAEVVVDELVDLAAALADQHDHVDVRVAAAREHAQQGALAAAGNGEDAHALAFTGRHRRIDGAHAGGERTIDEGASERIGRGGIDRRLDRVPDRALAVDRLAVGVEDAAEQAVAGAHRGLVAGGVHDGGGRNAFERAQRGQQGHLLGHAHHFGRQPELLVALAGRVAQDAQFADGRLQPGGADQGAVCLGDAADALDRLYPRQRAQQRIDRADRVLRLCRRCWLRCIHSWRPTPASAVRIASICWATPARTSPASDTTTQLSGSRLTSSTSSITPTAGCAWRTAPRPAATSSRTDGCTRIIRNCSACAASTACRTSGGTTLRASKSGAMRATIAQASSVTRLLASASTRA